MKMGFIFEKSDFHSLPLPYYFIIQQVYKRFNRIASVFRKGSLREEAPDGVGREGARCHKVSANISAVLEFGEATLWNLMREGR